MGRVNETEIFEFRQHTFSLTMETNQALALAGPLSYFALTILLLSVIAKSLKPKKLAPLPPVAVVYGILSVASFIHTFTCKYFGSILILD
jgi:hypothetical protein